MALSDKIDVEEKCSECGVKADGSFYVELPEKGIRRTLCQACWLDSCTNS